MHGVCRGRLRPEDIVQSQLQDFATELHEVIPQVHQVAGRKAGVQDLGRQGSRCSGEGGDRF
eukprot:13073591-Alexandrium_andersonii.AAC.1